ncbi:type II toxin-antitoxin system HicB family antitoxin [Oenococcus kitaharae]|uniref:Hypothetical phage protein n=1 Tax=Oenococcus kitaharae DSM 17330 TaxID=1045004 RepID=G9WIM4_9LACO|nr:type II toxin-antitoxin system HicB family antitoxin [Oenococcus kitaharae]EHN58163.1 hypothetical phage protein [Oenococcus kitaharae DSM 17330]OEY81635.1 hypothetical protein NT95_09140 [Oenococcus kitaharae]OEY83120.1 hypothetical protein NV75_07240 [Oenococcus kitaharae]OEY84334.1 hypothetical protein NT96_03395 [Oenococcus kitaharae]
MKERYLVYPAIFEKDGQGYVVNFPDVPNAFTEGDNLKQALVRASEVLGAILTVDYQDVYPTASDISQIKVQGQQAVYPVEVDLVQAREQTKSVSVKKNTTIPADLARRAEAQGINFSQTLTEALEKKLKVC